MSCTIFEHQPSTRDLCQMREWIKKTPYIIQDYDDEMLTAVIRRCKGSLQKSKIFLESLNRLGMRYPDYFGHLDILNENTQENLRHCFFTRDPAGDLLIFVFKLNPENPDPYKFHLFELMRHMLISFYVLVWENQYRSGEVVAIFDWKNVNPIYLREATPTYFRNTAEIRGKSYPFRIKALHHVNVPSVLEYFVNLTHSFFKNKLLERVHFHKSCESLHAHIPKEMLCKEYGGDRESALILNDRWKKLVESYRGKLIAENAKMRSLDPLRPKTNDFHDMTGTFRDLNVD